MMAKNRFNVFALSMLIVAHAQGEESSSLLLNLRSRKPFKDLVHHAVSEANNRGDNSVCRGVGNYAITQRELGDHFVGFCCNGSKFDYMCVEECSCNLDAGFTCYRSGQRETELCYGAASVSRDGRIARCHISGDPNYGNFVKTIRADDFCSHYNGKDKNMASPKFYSPQPVRDGGRFEVIVDSATNKSSTGLTMTHAAVVVGTQKVVLWTRAQKPDVPYQDGVEETVSTVYDALTGTYEAIKVADNPFCSGHSHLIDGSIVVLGGEMAVGVDWGQPWAPWLTEGRDKIRMINRAGTAWTSLPNSTVLPSYHWYPTQLTLDEHRVLNVGGFETALGPANPMVEVFDTSQNKVVRFHNSTSFTRAVGELNLYPYMSIIPRTFNATETDKVVLMFVGNYGELVRVTSDNDIIMVRKLAPLAENIVTHASAVGTGKLLALDPLNGYAAEFISFGGSNANDKLLYDCWCDVPALATSYRIDLDDPEAQWEVETMPTPRVGGTAVLLPTGHFVILNGAMTGTGNDFQGRPVLTPAMYNPYAPPGQRYSEMAPSEIPRLYHSNALLMDDGTVLVGGGEQGNCYSSANNGPVCGTSYDYEFRAEKFHPPYTALSSRPENLTLYGPDASEQVRFGDELVISFTTGVNVTGASIVHPSATTHSTDMSGRVVFLELTRSIINGTNGTVTLKIPTKESGATIGGWVMLFLLSHDGTAASKDSLWLQIK